LEKAELFVRPLLPDTSARKQLAALLLIRVKLLSSNRDSVILEICVLLLDFGDEKLTELASHPRNPGAKHKNS
jgi:hypothetical protein